MTDIYVLGVGQRFPDHLTLEVVEVLRTCSAVYTLLDASELPGLPGEIAERCVPVGGLYQPGRERDLNYADVFETVLKGAGQGTPVAWLTRGSPRILDSVSQRLVDEGARLGLVVTALPSVSSVDTVLNDVGYDPARGVLIVEGTHAVMHRTPFVPTVATLIFQPSVFGTFRPRFSLDGPGVDLTPLRRHLDRHFPGEHPVAFVTSSSDRRVAARIHWTTVGLIADTPYPYVAGSTVFIPPVSGGELDKDFVTAVRSAE